MTLSSSFVTIGYVLSLFFFVLVVSQSKKKRPDLLLSLFFFLSFVLLLATKIRIDHPFLLAQIPVLSFLSAVMLLASLPTLWLYTRALTESDFVFRKRYLIHYIPALIMFSVCFTNVMMSEDSDRAEYVRTYSYRQNPGYYMGVTLIAISSFIYSFKSYSRVRKFHHQLEMYLSSIENFDLKWMSSLMVSMFTIMPLLSFITLMDAVFDLFPFLKLQNYLFSFYSLIIVWIGYYGIRQGVIGKDNRVPVLAEDYDIQPLEKDLVKRSDTTDEDDVLGRRLLEYMQQNKPYLNPDITIASLSADLDIPVDVLSGYINNTLDQNFFDFINSYRVEEFKRKCSSPESRNYTLLSLAFECGFNSKATFNRVFKKMSGLTPSAYYQNVI